MSGRRGQPSSPSASPSRSGYGYGARSGNGYTSGPLQISSPQPRIAGGNPFDDRQRASPRPLLPSNRFRDEGSYELDHSPTHDYLEAFDSYPSTPDPNHTPIIPQLDSPAFQEKETEPMFGDNQYSSNQYLSNSPDAPPRRGGGPVGAGLDRGGRGRGGAGRGGAGRGAGRGTGRGGAAGPRPAGRGAAAPAGRGGNNAGYTKPSRTCVPTNPTKRRWLFFGLPAGIIIVAAIAVGVAVAVTKKGTSSSSSSSNSATTNSTTTTNSTIPASVPITKGSGTNGSTVTTDVGAKFTYVNNFGGNWAQDPDLPYNTSGRAQSWSPSLTEEWVWGTHIVRGVNLGGWLVTEPFIVPALYEPYQNTSVKAVDEYTLSIAMGNKISTLMEQHYATFITEQDFALIAGAGLNYVRIALGYWAVQVYENDPYLPKVSWNYFLKAIAWGRKYGIRILLDFHALPGSQNGWNHSGHAGVVNWMYGVMGIVNGQRSLETIRSFTEYISQDGVKQVVPMIGLVNEVQASIVGKDVMSSFYYQAYNLIRSVGGYGAGNGPIILMHEGFLGVAAWDGFLSGADRIGLDQHPYLAFPTTQTTAPISQQAATVCGWGGGTNDSQSTFGLIMGGEWSNAINDCGLWLDGVGSTPAYTSVGSCAQWDQWYNWNATVKNDVKNYAMANMDALQNWFFWTWKIGNSTNLGYASSPFWHYKLGLEQGWMPKDPRAAGGYCKSINVGGDQFNGTFPASALGVASPTIAATQLASHSAFPPTALGPSPSFGQAQIALFPTLTKTGSPVTLTTPTHAASVTIGSGWVNKADTAGAYVTVAGCSYPNAYNATASSYIPAAVCTGNRRRDLLVAPTATPIPTAAP